MPDGGRGRPERLRRGEGRTAIVRQNQLVGVNGLLDTIAGVTSTPTRYKPSLPSGLSSRSNHECVVGFFQIIGDPAARICLIDEDPVAGHDQKLVADCALDEDAAAIARQEPVPQGARELLGVAGERSGEFACSARSGSSFPWADRAGSLIQQGAIFFGQERRRRHQTRLRHYPSLLFVFDDCFRLFR